MTSCVLLSIDRREGKLVSRLHGGCIRPSRISQCSYHMIGFLVKIFIRQYRSTMVIEVDCCDATLSIDG